MILQATNIISMKSQTTHLYKILRLCQFSDSVLPIGGFAFSNSLESAIQLNIVHDEASLKEYIQAILKQNAYLDGIFVNHSFDAAAKQDITRLIELNKLYISRRIGKEQQLMSSRVGSKLATLYLEITSSDLLTKFLKKLDTEHIVPNHPIVHGIIMQENALSRAEAFGTYQYGISAMMLNAALRLMRIDHYQTQRVLFEANAIVDSYYDMIADYTIDETVSFAPIYDCLVSQHVNAHVRMFMN